MKTLILIESAEELLHLAKTTSQPSLPSSATLIFENNMNCVQLQAEGFALMQTVTVEDVIGALVNAAGIKVHIT